MPATEHRFSDAPPRELYLDTDFLLAALIASEPHHVRCAAFLRHLSATVTTLYVSTLTWVEYMDVVTRQRFRDSLDEAARQQFRLDRWQDSLVREHYVQRMRELLETLLKQFAWAEISITPQVRSGALQFIGEYGLRGQDAIHLAAMQQAGVFDLASLDEVFRRVAGLHLWNDQLHKAVQDA